MDGRAFARFGARGAMLEEIDIKRRDGIAHVALNRPSAKNAVTLAMWRELAEIFSRFAPTGTSACGRADGRGKGLSRRRRYLRIRARSGTTGSRAPTTRSRSTLVRERSPHWESRSSAAISGYCLGGGCHLALACDFRFGDRTAMVGIPAAKLSIVYGAAQRAAAAGAWREFRMPSGSCTRRIAIPAEQADVDGTDRRTARRCRRLRPRNSCSGWRPTRRFRSLAQSTC